MNKIHPTILRHHITQPLLLFLLLFVVLPAMAQDLEVDTMYLDGSDATARLDEITKYKEKDNNQKEPGVVKVMIAAENAEFSGCPILNEPKDRVRNASEYWLVIANGSRNLKITVPGYNTLEVDFFNYETVKRIKSKNTYILKIKVPDKGGKYDYSNEKLLHVSISPVNAILRLSGRIENLKDGKGDIELAQGKHSYNVEATGFHTEEGTIEIKEDGTILKDGNKIESFNVELKPRMGKLRIRTNTSSASVFVDGVKVDRVDAEPVAIQIGSRKVRVEAKGYAPLERTVEIYENETSTEPFNLSELNTFNFTSSPSGANLFVNGESIGVAPCSKDYTTGDYKVKATKAGYLDFNENMHLDSSNPDVHIKLKKIFNYKTEFYAEGNVRAGTFMAFGATLGGYFQNINAEVAFLAGSGESETIYWSGNNTPPIACTYSPSTNISLRLGYGFPISNRYRLTPQAGFNVLKLKESAESGGGDSPADGANTTMGVVGVRFSAALANHFAVSISPEFGFSMSKSKGYEALSEVSSDIKKWGEGFNVKLGLSAFF